MAGNIEVMTVDASRSTTIVMRGRKRYILAPSTECSKLKILGPKSHPSAGYSSLTLDELPKDTAINEVVLQAGDALLLPAGWFYSSIGLNQGNKECRALSEDVEGTPQANRQLISECGDFMSPSDWGLSW
mmetsp:Transcript_15843/g.23008  ORF Transcript_15843/g.23008 Transcript_15843/m.23008 type:complete len:130 (+) Transcript_15843:120-509(+)